jgi:hypothetical protein
MVIWSAHDKLRSVRLRHVTVLICLGGNATCSSCGTTTARARRLSASMPLLLLCFWLSARSCAARVSGSGGLLHPKPSSSAGDLQIAPRQTDSRRNHSGNLQHCGKSTCLSPRTCMRQPGCAWWRMPGAGRLQGGLLQAPSQLPRHPQARVASRLVALSGPAGDKHRRI